MRVRSEGTGVRALMLCHPHDPTGRVFTRAELEGLAALAIERDWLVIHADLAHPGHPFGSLSPEGCGRTVTFTSATKAFNIAGLRCGVAHFGSAALQLRCEAVLPAHAR